MGLIELDCVVTFGVGSTTIVSSPSVVSTTQVGTPTIGNGSYGTQIFAADHLAAVKAAVRAATAPWLAAYNALASTAAFWSNHPNNLNALANAYQNPKYVAVGGNGLYSPNKLPGSLNTFACPGHYLDPQNSDVIQGLVNADMSAAVTTALYGYLSNQNAPTAQKIVRAWMTTITMIWIQTDPAPNTYNMTYGSGSDSPLMAGTTLNGLLIAACILDEGLQGNWPASSGWTWGDRGLVENWIQNVYMPVINSIINPFVNGIPQSGMQNNWRSWAIYGWALSGFYLQGSPNPTTAATGRTMLTNAAAALQNAIAGTVDFANTAQYSSPDTQPQTPAIVRSTMTFNGITMQPGELFKEDLRTPAPGAPTHYNYYSLLPMCAAAQVLQAGYSGDLFTSQSTLLQLALTALLNRINTYGNSDGTFMYELFEAMGAVFGNASYTAYASPQRPVMPGANQFQHMSVFFAATLTSLLNWQTS